MAKLAIELNDSDNIEEFMPQEVIEQGGGGFEWLMRQVASLALTEQGADIDPERVRALDMLTNPDEGMDFREVVAHACDLVTAPEPFDALPMHDHGIGYDEPDDGPGNNMGGP